MPSLPGRLIAESLVLPSHSLPNTKEVSMSACNKPLGRGLARLVPVLMLTGSAATTALAEKVRGTTTCETGSFSRTIGGKAHTCTSKCTTPVTTTTCNPNCPSSVSIETTYGGCTANATGPSRNQNVLAV